MVGLDKEEESKEIRMDKKYWTTFNMLKNKCNSEYCIMFKSLGELKYCTEENCPLLKKLWLLHPEKNIERIDKKTRTSKDDDCSVKGCTNKRSQGIFIKDKCKPCSTMSKFSKAYRNKHKQSKCQMYKTISGSIICVDCKDKHNRDICGAIRIYESQKKDNKISRYGSQERKTTKTSRESKSSLLPTEHPAQKGHESKGSLHRDKISENVKQSKHSRHPVNEQSVKQDQLQKDYKNECERLEKKYRGAMW